MTAQTQRAPGWYADPLGADGLRLWDGSGWTDRTRLPSALAAPGWYRDPARPDTLRLWDGTQWQDQTRRHDGHQPKRRRRPYLFAGLGLIAIAAVIVLASHGGSRPSVAATGAPAPTASSHPSGIATSPRPRPPESGPDCTLARQRPSPVRALEWFQLNGLPVTKKDSAAVPAGACAVAAFTENGSSGTNLIISYPSSAAAARAASTVAVPRATELAAGIYVVQLNPGLQVKAAQYRAELDRYVSATKATA